MENSLPKQNIIATPRHVDIELTSRCNLRCKYCYFFNEPNHASEELTTKQWTNCFQELSSLQVMDVVLSGGEPFIREDIKELVDSIAANHMRYSFLSNGGLITNDIAKHIARNGRCDSVQISLDGGTADHHDIFRGTGSFDAAVKAIQMLQEYEIAVALRFTLHHHNVHAIRDAADFILNTLKLPGFSVNCAGYMGTCKTFANDIQLTVLDRILAMETLLELNQKYSNRIQASAGPLAEARTWKNMIEAHKNNAKPTGGYLSACGCMFSKLGIQSDGTIVPCNLLPQVKLGNILNDSIRDIWLSSNDLNDLRNREFISLTKFDMCNNCKYLNYCTGNCPGLAVSITGKINHPSPDACLRLFLESGGRVP